MCRIFCSPDREQRFRKYDFWEFCERLEKSLGKDGNGIYNLTTKELWKNHDRMPKEANIDGGILFHTRYATHGLVKDYNCQPFDNERYVFVHNGSFTLIESYARLLGFPFSAKKYSDSYMMAWVMEKVGILNFYNAFKSKYYGVIVVYDKKTDKIYMMKVGGSFEYGVFEDGVHIYGSSQIDYWKIKDKAIEMEKGLFILSSDGFTQLDKIVSVPTYYGSGYGSYYGRNYDYDKPSQALTKYKQKKIQKKLSRLYNRDNDDEEEPRGIGSLFANTVPDSCKGCNWLHKRKCWFGGVERENPLAIKDGDGNYIICNSKISKLDIRITCSECGKELKQTDKWEIYHGHITCENCVDYSETWGESCNECKYYTDPSDKEPCKSCWTGDGVATNWYPRDEDLCDGCYFDRLPKKDSYPCKVCEETMEGMSEWIQKIPENTNKCYICGYHFENDDVPLRTEDGEKVCWECERYGYTEELDEWDLYKRRLGR